MKIESLTPGMTVYDVHSYKMGNTTMRSIGVWHVLIRAVNVEKRTVEASWNGNQTRTFYERTWKKWRLKQPKLVETGFGRHRLQTRQEKLQSKLPITP